MGAGGRLVLGNEGCYYSFYCESQQPGFKSISRGMSEVAGLVKILAKNVVIYF